MSLNSFGIQSITMMLCVAGGLTVSQSTRAAVIFDATFDSSLKPDIAAGSNAIVYSQNVSITSGGPAVSGESLNATVLPSRLIYNAGANINLNKGTASFDYNLANKVVGTTYPLDLGSSNLNATGGLMLVLTHGPITGDPNGPSRWIVKWNGQSLPDYFQTIPTNSWNNIAVSWDMSGGAGNGILRLIVGGTVVQQRSDLDPIASIGVPYLYLSGSQYGGDSILGYIDNFKITDEVSGVPEPTGLLLLPAGLFALSVRHRRRIIHPQRS